MQKFARLLFLLILSVAVSSATTHTIGTLGLAFSPATISVPAGDTIIFSLSLAHNAVEVSQSTWDANGTTPLDGGFLVGFGGGSIVASGVGTHYYVCQAHVGLFGMKATITVTPAPPVPNTLIIASTVDQDANLLTTSDRNPKNWSLKVYKDSVGSGIVVDSVISGPGLTVNNLAAGTYVAVQADSASWSHLSVSLDGVSQGNTSVNSWPITVTSGEVRTIEFLNYAPGVIINAGFTFRPDSIVVRPGDTIRFVLETMHTAREVSQSTWNANDTVSNGGFDLPFAGGSVIMPASGTYYYVCVPHSSLGMKGRIFVIPPPANVAVNRPVSAGWNMVSLPVGVGNASTTSLFPGASSSAFSYQGSYTSQTSLANGSGYWLKFPSDQSAGITGTPRTFDTVHVSKGWNIIGSISSRLLRTSLSSVPGAIITSQLFGYNGSYFSSDTLVPGYGYWVKVGGDGRIILDSAAAAFPKPERGGELLSRAHPIILRDAAGREQRLLLATGEAGAGMPESMNEIPPPPPSGAFDARFRSDVLVGVIDRNRSVDLPIDITSARYPVTVRWEAQPSLNGIALAEQGMEFPLSGEGAITIAGPGRLLSVKTLGTQSLPSAYLLENAYPNPFNPSTSIRYRLPADSHVLLRVYGVLGQILETLVDDTQPAGLKSAIWTPGGISSGVYLVRLDVSPVAGGATPYTGLIKVLFSK